MKSFIAAVPIFDSDMSVAAYRMNTQNGNKFFGMANDYTAMNDAMNSIGMEILTQIGVEPFTGGKPVFVDCNEFHIVTGLPRRCGVSPELLVCVIPKDTQADNMVVRQCQALKNAGYSIALNNIPFGSESKWLYVLADYVLIDSQSPNVSKAIYNARLSNRRMKIVLTGIPNQAAFEKLKSVPFCLFEGNFYSAPVTRGSKDISPLKLNALRLLKIVGEEDFDLSEASNVISRDPALTISLLRLINSSAVGISRKINDIKSAVAILGQREVKKWVIVSISNQLAEDKPNEITKLSLVRAKFAEKSRNGVQPWRFRAEPVFGGVVFVARHHFRQAYGEGYRGNFRERENSRGARR